ncbi:TPR repeat-containing protein C19B12.01 [Leucoagaricus sp. SymC.cos]|nr:TPR repeat-containing protein C19B12.01 [Leucoagaricus sp. SymC.cos]
MDRAVALQIEKTFIRGIWDSGIPTSSSPAAQIAKKVVDGEFREVLTSSEARKIIRVQNDDLDRPLEDIFDFSASFDGDLAEQELLRLSLAIALFHAFVQANWTGPDLDFNPLEVITFDKSESELPLSEDLIKQKAVAELAYGGEPAYHLTTVPVFLRLAQLLLTLPYLHLQTLQWWQLRFALAHQQILDEPVADSDLLSASLKPLESLLSSEPDLLGRLYLERGRLDHIYSQDKSAAEYFLKAARATGLEYELTGALGKRTRFQQTELSQLVLLAESRLNDDTAATSNSTGIPTQNGVSANTGENFLPSGLPETLPLNDDTLLEQTEFTSSHPASSDSRLLHINPQNQPPLHPVDQCIFLSLCLNVKNTSPSHGLTTEQMVPYVSRVVSHPRNWSVHTMALLLRSRLESSRTRTAERSTLQLQALIDQMPTSDSTLSGRLRYFHSIPLPSKWELEKELALRFVSLGVVKSALEIFTRLEMWEEVVKCWGLMERPEKGIAIVRDLLEGRKSEADVVVLRGKTMSEDRRHIMDTSREAKLWCLLGDLEPQKAIEHYERAWSISKHSSGRAMRALGGYYFARGRYSEAITCLRDAVKINPLLARSWFMLGCAYMRTEDWEGARNAFSRCVAIDEEDGESWNNLASMYLRLGTPPKRDGQHNDKDDGSMTYNNDLTKLIPFDNKMLAFRALKQGLRHSYENWRMWYNYMIVSVDVGQLNEACRALGRVVEETSGKIGAKSVDEDVLDRLVDAVTRGPVEGDNDVESSSTSAGPNQGRWLFTSVNNLFDRVLLPRVSSPRVFRAYARLLTWQSKWEEAIKAYLDAYRNGPAGTMEKGETDVKRWREAVQEVEEIVDLLRNFGSRAEGYKWKNQARSILRTFVGRTKDFEDEPEWERLKELQDELRRED